LGDGSPEPGSLLESQQIGSLHQLGEKCLLDPKGYLR
jgi:hypothetical protein